jgi:hypothetical protein
MAILTKYKSFEDLKSSENLRTENSLNSKAISKEFENFISILRSAKKMVNQSNNHITRNGQKSER